MAINEKLTARVREVLADTPKVVEKKMFRGITFMVNGKMCMTVGDDRIMCRIDPTIHEEAISRDGCCTVEMGGRKYIGYVYVSEAVLKTKSALEHWTSLALDFNKKAKASKKSPKKPAKKTSKPTTKKKSR